MSTFSHHGLVHVGTPRGTPGSFFDEERLAEQERLLARLTEELATREAEAATMEAEFGRFRAAYAMRFGPLYAELDRLQAEIRRRTSNRQGPTISALGAQSVDPGEGSSDETDRGARPIDDADTAQPSRTTDQGLRDLYRRAAKLMHPDTAESDEERARRTTLMAAINDAYARGDAEAIRRAVEGESTRPEVIVGSDDASRMARTVRMIARIRARLAELDALRRALATDPMWQLFMQCRGRWLAGDDPLAADERGLRTRIASAAARLADLLINADIAAKENV
ncbi:MAG: J domain-containing protein [Solirubrobacterales bacterium]